MTDSLWALGLGDFRDRTASADPVPGGGSAATVAAAIGLGLVLMALRVSARKKDATDNFEALILSGERLMEQLSLLADVDVDAFEQYMAAIRLPKASADEQAARRAAMVKALQAATEVPLTAAQTMLEALDLARRAVPVVAAGIVSDAAAGAVLLHGALTAVLYNVDVNLKSLGDAAIEYRQSRRHLQQAADDRRRAIDGQVRERLTP